MTTKTTATRRSFMSIAGAALSAPLAAAATHLPGKAGDGDPLRTRLAMLEDLDAIRALNQAFARHVNARAHEETAALFANPSDALIDENIRGIAADDFGDRDAIDVAADRQTAKARLHCTVHLATAISPSCPMVEMARLQGGGVVTWSEPGVFENSYVRRDGVWKIRRSTRLSVERTL